MDFLFVALGGAAGAMGRYAIGLLPVKASLPILTLAVNIIGAALIGFIAGAAEGSENVSQNAVLFWKTGVCGGFTTFSTFSLETLTLFESKAYFLGSIYIFLSVACCLLGVLLGKKLSALAR